MRSFTLSFALAAVLLSTPLLAADSVPLSTNLKFDPVASPKKTPITLVASPDLSQKIVQKKLRFLRLDFPLGNALAVNTETALRSAFAKVKLARSVEDVETPLSLELKDFEVTPKLPMTTFGTYTAKVKYTFLFRDAKNKSERLIAVEGDGGNKKGAGRVIWDAGWRWTEAQQLAKATDLASIDALDQLIVELTK